MLLNDQIPVGKRRHMDSVQDVADFSSLLKRVGDHRDRQAFALLFEHFAPRLKAFLMKGGSDPSLAEELMQETMVTVWRKAGLFDPGKARVSTWIFTIARNLRIDRLRKDSRPEADWTDPALAPTPVDTADTIVSLGQDQERIKKAISGLSPEQVEVIQLCFYKDLSHAEIAARLDIPLGTVKSRIRLAIGKIRIALEDA